MSRMKMESVDKCILCGMEGEPLYHDLHDRVFGVEGSFSHRLCKSCELIWMDPRPVKEDIGKCYKGFYSPDAPLEDINVHGGLKKLKAIIRDSIYCGHYGYRHIHNRHPFCFLGGILHNMPYVGPAATYGWEALVPHCKSVKDGLVVDVGCGRGELLSKLQNLGCRVLGIEPDEAGSAILNKKGIKAFCGTLEDAHLEDASVAHLTMRHVLEHLSDPIKTLNECFRVLSPGGKLVLRLPNGASLNHAIFKSDWYQLDPPRHLFIFTPKSISLLCRKTGFSKCRIRTLSFSAKGTYDTSVIIRKFGRVGTDPITAQPGRWPLTFKMHLLSALGIPCGEELEVVLTKG